MDKEDKAKISNNYNFLIEHLVAKNLLPHFVQAELISLTEQDDILRAGNTNDVNREFINKLIRCGPKAYRCFIDALKECKKCFIVEELERTVDVKKHKIFQLHGSDSVADLCALENGSGWACDLSENITIIDEKGTFVRRLHVAGDGCRAITITDDKSVYISCNDKSICKFSATSEQPVWRQQLNFLPLGLAFDQSKEELLVCGGGEGLYSVKSPKVTKKLNFNFEWALDVAVDTTSKICVIDSLQGKVFIFSNELHVATYDKESAGNINKLSLFSVTCSNKGHFIITDPGNYTIHVINSDGSLVERYQTKRECDKCPLTLSMTAHGQLWVGFVGGTVCIYNVEKMF